MDEEEVAHLFAQVVLPMFYIHNNQILHRDIKSENIFLTRTQDQVKIGDFGISKILSSKSKAYTVVGTPCYISPELCEGLISIFLCIFISSLCRYPRQAVQPEERHLGPGLHPVRTVLV